LRTAIPVDTIIFAQLPAGVPIAFTVKEDYRDLTVAESVPRRPGSRGRAHHNQISRGEMYMAKATIKTRNKAASGPPPTAKKTLFSSLKVGQPVTLRDKGESYEISVTDGDPGNHTVAEIGDDYIVLQDVADVAELRIPLHAIRDIVHVKTKLK